MDRSMLCWSPMSLEPRQEELLIASCLGVAFWLVARHAAPRRLWRIADLAGFGFVLAFATMLCVVGGALSPNPFYRPINASPASAFTAHAIARTFVLLLIAYAPPVLALLSTQKENWLANRAALLWSSAALYLGARALVGDWSIGSFVALMPAGLLIVSSQRRLRAADLESLSFTRDTWVHRQEDDSVQMRDGTR